ASSPSGVRGCEAFFFSSRRRHTRSKRDWSSDVCSSDLMISALISFDEEASEEENKNNMIETISYVKTGQVTYSVRDTEYNSTHRSEERRVGKECRCQWTTETEIYKNKST